MTMCLRPDLIARESTIPRAAQTPPKNKHNIRPREPEKQQKTPNQTPNDDPEMPKEAPMA